MHAVASEQQQKEANIKEALEEQLAQVRFFNLPFSATLLRFRKLKGVGGPRLGSSIQLISLNLLVKY